MLRTLAATGAAIACIAAPVAEACICPWYQTQAEIDADGARALSAADLIVEATVGDVSWWHRTACGSPGPFGFGQAISADRPITVHRTVKGRAGPSPTLIGNKTTVQSVGSSSVRRVATRRFGRTIARYWFCTANRTVDTARRSDASFRRSGTPEPDRPCSNGRD
ncbi:MAG TPA: hypothetical protein VFO80_12010 [Sphingomonas sp.]|nr:hypothetical protein [Sphingomonas sp.]